jgi:predicted nucleic acid-binding protein
VKIIVDSYAWIEIFLGSAAGGEAREKIMKADQVFTPDTVLAEIARKYHREEIALDSAKAYEELESKARKERLDKPSLFDAIVLAVARANDGKVLTGDRHFQNLHETVWLE